MRVILTLPKELVTAFKAESAKQLPRIAAFHEANGNEEVADAVETAQQATISL